MILHKNESIIKVVRTIDVTKVVIDVLVIQIVTVVINIRRDGYRDGRGGYRRGGGGYQRGGSNKSGSGYPSNSVIDPSDPYAKQGDRNGNIAPPSTTSPLERNGNVLPSTTPRPPDKRGNFAIPKINLDEFDEAADNIGNFGNKKFTFGVI